MVGVLLVSLLVPKFTRRPVTVFLVIVPRRRLVTVRPIFQKLIRVGRVSFLSRFRSRRKIRTVTWVTVLLLTLTFLVMIVGLCLTLVILLIWFSRS